MTAFEVVFRSAKRIKSAIENQWHSVVTTLRFKGNGVSFDEFRTRGIPYVMVARGGKMVVGKNLSMNNIERGNPIGCHNPCTFFVDSSATLRIGENLGISQSALVAHADITIGDNVKIGGGTCVFTTDFHSLDPTVRNSPEDMVSRDSRPVIIHDNVFIGARVIILKGVSIGENSIIGAGSVVTKSVPPNQIWAGNPARYIRTI